MPRLPRPFLLAAALLWLSPALPGVPAASTARADGDAAQPPAPVPADLYEQTDRKRTMTMKLPRAWKSVSGDQADAAALATFRGFYGPDSANRPGLAAFYVENQFGRASLARAILLPAIGAVKAASMRQGPGWAEGCAVDAQRQAEWRRYVEKAGRVYVFRIAALDSAYDAIHADVEKLLDSAAVPGEYAPSAIGAGFTARKSAEFDVMSDADADREKSIAKACTGLAAGRDAVVKMLPGKPFDAGKPAAWIFQNAQKFEDRAKAAMGSKPERAAFNAPDRCAMVSILGEATNGQEEAVTFAGAQQYVWQYFGGAPPIWIESGLSRCGQLAALGGGKGKTPPDAMTKAKAAIAAGKRRLDEWFDVVLTNEVTDMDQASLELFGWHTYFRTGRGAKKFKKQYDAYIQSLRDTGDPAAARKAFDGVNFADMLADFKSWAADWK
jgi:hypothetical protein